MLHTMEQETHVSEEDFNDADAYLLGRQQPAQEGQWQPYFEHQEEVHEGEQNQGFQEGQGDEYWEDPANQN